jgi:hypothetical protein
MKQVKIYPQGFLKIPSKVLIAPFWFRGISSRPGVAWHGK